MYFINNFSYNIIFIFILHTHIFTPCIYPRCVPDRDLRNHNFEEFLCNYSQLLTIIVYNRAFQSNCSREKLWKKRAIYSPRYLNLTSRNMWWKNQVKRLFSSPWMDMYLFSKCIRSSGGTSVSSLLHFSVREQLSAWKSSIAQIHWFSEFAICYQNESFS